DAPSSTTRPGAIPSDSNAGSTSGTDHKPFRSASAGRTSAARRAMLRMFLREGTPGLLTDAQPSRAKWHLRNPPHSRPKATMYGQIEHELRRVPNSGPARTGYPRRGSEDLPWWGRLEQARQIESWQKRLRRDCQAPTCLYSFLQGASKQPGMNPVWR